MASSQRKSGSPLTARLANRLRKRIRQSPFISPIARRVYRALDLGRRIEFTSSSQYWEERYAVGGDSGAGSYGRLADFKAKVLNTFVAENSVNSVIEFGSGDGAQLDLSQYPSYVGIDVSEAAVALCRSRFADDASKRFFLVSDPECSKLRAELALSIDVIYHLVEDDIYEQYMTRLVSAAERFIGIYSSNMDRPRTASHVRHRVFTDWMKDNAADWQLISIIKNPYAEDPSDPDRTTWADFFFYERRDNGAPRAES